VDASNLVKLNLQLDGHLQVVCQRCLQSMLIPVERESSYLLCQDEEEEESLTSKPHDGNLEVLVLSNQISDKDCRRGELDLSDLLADELILSIPLYPRHTDENECQVLDGLGEPDTLNQTKDTVRPFANLQDLLKQ